MTASAMIMRRAGVLLHRQSRLSKMCTRSRAGNSCKMCFSRAACSSVTTGSVRLAAAKAETALTAASAR